MRAFPKRPLRSLAKVFFPQRCIGCGKGGVALCDSCIASIPLASAPEILGAFAVYDYSNRLVELAIKEAKYHRRTEALIALTEAATPYIAEWLADTLQSEARERLLLVPTPQNHRAERRRSFNQSELIAKTLAGGIEGARVIYLLKKVRETPPQARIADKATRLENVKASMKVSGFAGKDVTYVVIDDVTTTGATLTEARRAILSAGARNVLCVALAHGYARKR